MANTIILKHSTTTGKAPAPADLAQGELAVNLADAALFTKDDSNAVVRLNPTGASVVGAAGVNIATGGALTQRFAPIGGAAVNRTALGEYVVSLPGNLRDTDFVQIRVGGVGQFKYYEQSIAAGLISIEVRDIEQIGHPLVDPEYIIFTVAR